jgi:hypothetical protein
VILCSATRVPACQLESLRACQRSFFSIKKPPLEFILNYKIRFAALAVDIAENAARGVMAIGDIAQLQRKL